MIYLLSKQQELFETDLYKYISQKDALELVRSFDVTQHDTETSGRNARLCKLLCSQYGNKKQNIQLVVDHTTIDPEVMRPIIEDQYLIGHNLKFDIQFWYNHGIIPKNVYDTMIIEQLLHLGFDNKYFHYSLKAVAERRLGIDIDKTTRGEIIWRGLDPKVILYAAGDVQPLEDIREQQINELTEFEMLRGAELENRFVPVIAYLEWCGIRLDEIKWLTKMHTNDDKRLKALEALNDYLVKLYNNDSTLWSGMYQEKMDKFGRVKKVYIPWVTRNLQGDLFTGFDDAPKASINWDSPIQMIPFFKLLGFDTKTEDKKTGESKDSVVEKLIAKQKGINDEFLELYFAYKETSKDCSTYGQNYLDAVNPVTGRIHTTFKQLGAASGRMSCGNSLANDTDLANYKHISPTRCKYVQLQNLPADDVTRGSFVPNKGNLMTSCDYAALESRLGADIYNEPAMIEEFLYRSGDIHSLTAKACFPEELDGIPVEEIKNKRPDLRKRAKPVEFSQQFGGSAKAIQNSLGCTMAEAKQIAANYNNGFKGIAKFKEFGSAFVREHGYVLICRKTGHRLIWEDFKKWKEMDSFPDNEMKWHFSNDEVKEHNMAASKWDRMALNAPTQGTGIIILKYAMTLFFKWICQEGLFNKVLICDLVHDEAVIEFPEEMKDIVPNKLKYCMEKAASVFCKKLPIPAVPETGLHWIH